MFTSFMMLYQMQVKKPCGMAERLRMTKGKGCGAMLKYARKT
jgi:hypothetical protein